jgi:hypothetical protein
MMFWAISILKPLDIILITIDNQSMIVIIMARRYERYELMIVAVIPFVYLQGSGENGR